MPIDDIFALSSFREQNVDHIFGTIKKKKVVAMVHFFIAIAVDEHRVESSCLETIRQAGYQDLLSIFAGDNVELGATREKIVPSNAVKL